MVRYFIKITVIAVINNCVVTTFTKPTEAIPFFEIDNGNSNGVEENDGNHPFGYFQEVDFFTKLAQPSINQKLERFESRIRLLELYVRITAANLSREFQSLKMQVEKKTSDEKDKMESTTSTTTMPQTGLEFSRPLALQTNVDSLDGSSTESIEAKIPNVMTYPDSVIDCYLKNLSLPKKGNSFQGSAIENIAAEVPDNHGLVIQIVNYLDSNLSHHQLFLYAGSKHGRAPATVPSKTREVLTFKPLHGSLPNGIMSLQIENTKFSLHLYFWTSAGRIAVGFFGNSAPIATMWSLARGCSKYSYTGTENSFRCIEDYEPWNPNKTVIIHQGPFHAKLTGHCQNHTYISKLEIFNIEH